eukprot:TRINITY_DN11320_c0_g1_i1.p1 TRINITY_DN11320_c0_g1~~TRINITY_DN11320_c0_g1_i1.p1  ORF type:complete len:227 (-),score=89.45 TRINITY_DN11320_c0_g1_i1:175-855(-)
MLKTSFGERLRNSLTGSPKIKRKSSLADLDETQYTDTVDGRYIGTMIDGKKQGAGKLLWSTGDVYVGHWDNNMKNGKGTMTWVNGDVYDGTWKDDMREGDSTKTTYSNGGVYIGGFKADTRHGPGKYFWPDGDTYEGTWTDGRRTGKGVLLTNDGKRFEQDWEESEVSYSVCLPSKHPFGGSVEAPFPTSSSLPDFPKFSNASNSSTLSPSVASKFESNLIDLDAI